MTRNEISNFVKTSWILFTNLRLRARNFSRKTNSRGEESRLLLLLLLLFLLECAPKQNLLGIRDLSSIEWSIVIGYRVAFAFFRFEYDPFSWLLFSWCFFRKFIFPRYLFIKYLNNSLRGKRWSRKSFFFFYFILFYFSRIRVNTVSRHSGKHFCWHVYPICSGYEN